MTRATNTAWRWLTTVATIAAAAIAMTAALATPAHAAIGIAPSPNYSCRYASEAPNFIGWSTIAYRGCAEPGAPSTADCKAISAYRWTGSAWQYHGLSECGGPRQVYVYPYAAGWSWIWSQQTGWLAVRSDLVIVSSGYLVGGCGAAGCHTMAH